MKKSPCNMTDARTGIHTYVFFSGMIFDATQSYQYSFIVSGVLIGVAGLIALPVRRIAAMEARGHPQGVATDYIHVETEEGDTNEV